MNFCAQMLFFHRNLHTLCAVQYFVLCAKFCSIELFLQIKITKTFMVYCILSSASGVFGFILLLDFKKVGNKVF